MSWFGFGRSDDNDDIRRELRDLKSELKDAEYSYHKALDELDRAERNNDSDSERRWDDLAYKYKCKIEDIEYDIRDLERRL